MKRCKESYPEEMTIVLEHQFWDLSANDDGFEVTLKFGGVPKYLFVPWRAVTRFHDPSVDFRLHFTYEAAGAAKRRRLQSRCLTRGRCDQSGWRRHGGELGSLPEERLIACPPSRVTTC
jgi:hypothetical protein